MKPKVKLTEKSWLIILAAIGLVYILLRFWHLTDSCLWFDEIFSVHAAEQDWQNLFRFVAQDLIHPPLFYALLKLWILAGGESLFWVRFFPVFFAIVALVPFYFLCRALKLSFAAMAVALAFFAANGALIKYAQEVRMYSLLLCLSLFSLWLFVRFFNLGKSFWILTIINILLVYTHYFGWFVVFSEVLAILILQRIKTRQILISFGIALVAFVPWILAVWQAARQNADLAQNIGWIGKPNLMAVSQFIFDLIEPFYFQASSAESSSNFFVSVPILLLTSAAGILYFADWKKRSETERHEIYLPLIFFITPVLLAFIISWLLPYSIWGSRHLIIVFAPALILAAKFLTEIKKTFVKAGFLYLILLCFGFALLFQSIKKQPEYIWCAWENLARDLDVSQPQKVYVFEDLVAYHFWFALRRDSDKVQIVEVKNIEGIIEDKAYFLPRGFDSVQITDENGITDERFWIAFRDKEFNLLKPPLQNLIARGYRIGAPKEIQAQGLKAFLVEVSK